MRMVQAKWEQNNVGVSRTCVFTIFPTPEALIGSLVIASGVPGLGLARLALPGGPVSPRLK